MRLHGRVMLVALLLASAACGDDDDAATSNSEQTAKKVATALTSNVLFADGVVELGEIPDTSEDTVSLKQEDQVLSLEPDTAEILALEVDNPGEGDNPVESTLMQFEGDEDHHVEVPKGTGGGDAGTDAGAGANTINIDFMVDGDVCAKLCDDTFTITMVQAVKLKKGGISKHLKRTIKLDCSKKGDHSACPKESTPSTSGSSGKGGSGGSSSAGKGGSGGSSSSAIMDTTLGAEFGRVLAAANTALCTKCAPFKGTTCAAMLPKAAVACVQDAVAAKGGRADASAKLNEIAVKLGDILSACMACDYTMCDPNYLANELANLPEDLQTDFNTCAEDAGGMIGSSYDAGATP